MGRRLAVIGALGFVAVQAYALAQMKTFRDPGTGVAFSYPVNWKDTDGHYIPAAILSNRGPAKAVVRVGFAGVPGTNLTDVEFVYANAPAEDEKVCAAMAGTGRPGNWMTIGGVRYWHVAGGDAAMMKQAVQNSYAAWRAGTCLLFEKDVYTMSVDAQSGVHAVPQARLDAINKQLDGVMASVVIQKRH